MSVEFLAFSILGRLLIYLVQKAAKFQCDLCVGVWIYAILSGLFQIRLLEDVYWYVPVASQLITGCVTSYLVHLVTIGFREKHLPVII